MSPYQMAAKEGKYYLICNFDKYNDISNYRLDRIADIRILDEPAKPFEKLEWAKGQPLDLASYMKEHPYMYAAENLRVKFWVCKEMVSDVIDLFGSEVYFSKEDENGIIVTTVTNGRAIEQFARNFGPDVIILEPKGLREKVRGCFEKGAAAYEQISQIQTRTDIANGGGSDIMLNAEELQKTVDFLEDEFDLENIELPDEYNYTCLPLCLLDAVFSIGVTYSSTRNTVQRYCEKYGIPCYNREDRSLSAFHTISDFIKNIESVGTEYFATDVLENRQRTSSRNGILKAQAVLDCAKVFQKNRIEDLQSFNDKMNSDIEKEFLKIKGQSSGISLKYLKMLCGDENNLKPDRHIVNFLDAHFSISVNKDNAGMIMKTILGELAKRYPGLKMRELDFIIWQYQSNS